MENSKIKKKPPLSRRKKNKGNLLTLLQYQRSPGSPKLDTVSIFISIQHNIFYSITLIFLNYTLLKFLIQIRKYGSNQQCLIMCFC